MPKQARRRFDRRYFAQMGAVDVGDGAASSACEILDISQGGARLRPLMCAPQTLPERFILLLSSCGRVRRNCRVVWRSAIELGVQFHRT